MEPCKCLEMKKYLQFIPPAINRVVKHFAVNSGLDYHKVFLGLFTMFFTMLFSSHQQFCLDY